MLIHVAESGRSYELDCVGATTVEVVQNTLTALTGVPAAEQMLICKDTRLEASRTLASYSLPAEDCHCFLFNRARLLPDTPGPPPEEEEPIEVQWPPEPSLANEGRHPLDGSPNPLLRALPTYERLFRYHLQRGEEVFRASQARYDACRRLVQEQHVQGLALESASSNMGLYYRHICAQHADFTAQFAARHAAHAELLASFGADMERLRACDLHPALRERNPSRRTLLDCVKQDALRRWRDECAVGHAQLAGKVGELRAQFAAIQRSVEELLHMAPDVDVEQLEQRLERSHKLVQEQASILQSLRCVPTCPPPGLAPPVPSIPPVDVAVAVVPARLGAGPSCCSSGFCSPSPAPARGVGATSATQDCMCRGVLLLRPWAGPGGSVGSLPRAGGQREGQVAHRPLTGRFLGQSKFDFGQFLSHCGRPHSARRVSDWATSLVPAICYQRKPDCQGRATHAPHTC